MPGDHVRRPVQRQVHRRRRARVRAQRQGHSDHYGGRTVAALTSQRRVRERPRGEEHPRAAQSHRRQIPAQGRPGGHRGRVQRHQGISIRALVHRTAGGRQVVRRALRHTGGRRARVERGTPRILNIRGRRRKRRHSWHSWH